MARVLITGMSGSGKSTVLAALSGTSENQGRFYDQFDHVVLLSAPVDVRRSATIELDARLPVQHLADAIETLEGVSPSRG